MALVQRTPTLFLSFEATQTLRDCHRVAPKDNGTLLRDAVTEARSYALWDYAGLATRDRKALEARLVDADASWEAYRARLERLSLGSARYDVAPGTPRAPSPPPPLDAAARRLPAAELAAFSPRRARYASQDASASTSRFGRGRGGTPTRAPWTTSARSLLRRSNGLWSCMTSG